MMLEKTICLLISAVASTLILNLTLACVPQSCALPMFLLYFIFTFLIFSSVLSVIKNRTQKEGWHLLLVGVDGLTMVVSLLAGLFGYANESTKRNLFYVSWAAFVLLFVFLKLWCKPSTETKENDDNS